MLENVTQSDKSKKEQNAKKAKNYQHLNKHQENKNA